MKHKYQNIPWLSDEDYAKAQGQLRLQLNAVFGPFRVHGLDVYIPGAIAEIVKLAEDFSLRVRGADKPLDIGRIRRGNK